MPTERDLNLDTYNISGNRYRELKYFCRQYREKQSRLRSMTEIGSPAFDGNGGCSGRTSDRTADTAIKKAELQKDLDLIEQTAIEADAEIYQYIISNVVDGVPWEYLGVPMGRRKFYETRKKFFYLLSEKRG